MAGIDNQGFDDSSLKLSEKNESAILNVNKEKYFKITKSGQVKFPRRVLHCSDGVYEEYSSSEDEDEADLQPVVDPKTLTWGPYIWYFTTKSAVKGLAVCDFLGEKLAWFFGITSPRYQYALDEVERMKEEEEEQADQEREEREAELQMVKTTKLTKPSTNYGSSDAQTAALEVNSIDVVEKEGDH